MGTIGAFWDTSRFWDEVGSQLALYSQFNHYENPYVSTTSAFHRAFLYATRFGRSFDEGYVSIIRVEAPRMIDFRSFAEDGVDLRDMEVAVDGAIFPAEIIAQVPVSEIVRLIPDADLACADTFQKYKDVLTAEKYRFLSKPILSSRCPACLKGLYPYLSECIGTDDEQLATYSLAAPKGGSDFLAPDAIGQLLALQGKIVRCMHCKGYVFNPQIAHQIPVRVLQFCGRASALCFLVHNGADEAIDALTIGVVYEKEGRRYWQTYQRQFRNFRPIIMGLAMPRWDHIIPPHTTVTQEAAVERDEDLEIKDIRIIWAHFENGRTWVPFDCLDWAPGIPHLE